MADSVGTIKRTAKVKLKGNLNDIEYYTSQLRGGVTKLGRGFLPLTIKRCAVCEANIAHTKYQGTSSLSGNARGECLGYVEKTCNYHYTEYTH